jgi:teichuronic acid biosynthesis glycosyltransferase TuaG
MINSLFSIVIPTYNRKHCISGCINSIISQCFKEVEIIVVDDASTDNTSDLIQEFISNHSNIKYLKLSINSGTNIAKNEGASLAKGEYLVFLDSDDRLLNNDSLLDIKLKLETFKYPSIAMFSCIDLDGNLLSNNPNFEGILDFQNYFKGKIKGEYLPIVQAQLFNKFKFDPLIRGGEHMLWQKLTLENSFIFISSLVVRLYDNKGLDRMSFKNQLQIDRILKVYKRDLKTNYRNYLKYNLRGMFLTGLKIVFYQIQSSFLNFFYK